MSEHNPVFLPHSLKMFMNNEVCTVTNQLSCWMEEVNPLIITMILKYVNYSRLSKFTKFNGHLGIGNPL
jgi:hypothetical protein